MKSACATLSQADICAQRSYQSVSFDAWTASVSLHCEPCSRNRVLVDRRCCTGACISAATLTRAKTLDVWIKIIVKAASILILVGNHPNSPHSRGLLFVEEESQPHNKIMSKYHDKVSSFSWAGMRKNPSVLPVVGCIVIGVALATAYTLRLAIFNPDVTWNSRKNPIPQNYYENRNYKFLQSEPFDVKNYQHPRPRF